MDGALDRFQMSSGPKRSMLWSRLYLRNREKTPYNGARGRGCPTVDRRTSRVGGRRPGARWTSSWAPMDLGGSQGRAAGAGVVDLVMENADLFPAGGRRLRPL